MPLACLHYNDPEYPETHICETSTSASCLSLSTALPALKADGVSPFQLLKDIRTCGIVKPTPRALRGKQMHKPVYRESLASVSRVPRKPTDLASTSEFTDRLRS